MSRRTGEPIDKPSLEEMEAPEGYEWHNKNALLLECKRCGRFVYAREVAEHEIEHTSVVGPDEIEDDVQQIPDQVQKRRQKTRREMNGV